MVRQIFMVTVGLAAILATGACEHIEQLSWKGERPARVIDARTGREEKQTELRVNAMQGAPAPTAHNFPPPNERDLMVIADKLGSGSVEIYDINSRAPRTYGGGVTHVDNGMPTAVDSSVMVYPVDGGYPGQVAATWPNSILPSQQMPMPLQNSNAVPASIAGRTSPHAGGPGVPAQIFFAHGFSTLGPGDRQVLRDVSEKARFAPVDRVSVEGHASSRADGRDQVTAKIVNLKESMNRAFNVSSEMMRNGVPAEKIKTTVWGDTKNTSGSEAENRRVDIIGAQ